MKKFLLGLFATCFAVGCSAENRGGFTSVDAKEFAKAIEVEGVQLVDARTPSEFAQGHIPGAINIDVNGQSWDAETGKLDKKQPVAIYCRSGRRSKIAAERLVNQGFEKITELDGGILSWDGEVEK